MPTRDELLTTAEVAEALRVHPATVRRMRAQGHLPTVRVGALVRVPRAAVDEYVRAHTEIAARS